MKMTPYHARYYAMLLTRRASQNIAKYLPAIMSANIDIHPHQIAAALFASRSQFRDGVILADEKGLGRGVEAGIVLLQNSIDGLDKQLVICKLDKYDKWRRDLDEKFSLDAVPLENAGNTSSVVVMTYPEALKNCDKLSTIPWELCVLDDAHELANSGIGEKVMSDAIRLALGGKPKLLLTPTPMQNSLLDLYYLIRFVDETAFGSDPEVFRARYMGNRALKQELASRAQMICQRTLKRQAITMQLPNRVVRTILVPPSPEENTLSKRMSLYFHRDPLLAFPKIQEHYIRLTYWKLLASSPDALYEGLQRPLKRMENMADENIVGATEELADLREVADMVETIKSTSRGTALLTALKDAMSKLNESGAPQKAIIFSENRKTLAFLERLLCANGYKNKIAIWSTGASGKKALEAFIGKAQVLLATDSLPAEPPMMHCAFIVNFDLPWNVQKLERRIARCHSYGQKHDVLVVNFLDPENRSDKRIYTLLNKKLKQFDDVFGVTEGVLISPDTGLRTQDEIKAEATLFEQKNSAEIERRTIQAEADLLAHFDEEVVARFKHIGETVPEMLSQMEHWLWEITKYKLHNKANLDDERKIIMVHKSPYKGLRLSRISYGMDKTLPRGERYRLDSPLAKHVLTDCLDGELSEGHLILSPGSGFTSGMKGEIGLWKQHFMSGINYTAQPVLCGFCADGTELDYEECARLLKLAPTSCSGGIVYKDEEGLWMGTPGEVGERLNKIKAEAFQAQIERFTLEQDESLSSEMDKLRRWAEDEQMSFENRQKELPESIARLKEQVLQTSDFASRFKLNKELAELEKTRRKEEDRLFLLGAEIERKRIELMDAAKEKCQFRTWDELLFVARWSIE